MSSSRRKFSSLELAAGAGIFALALLFRGIYLFQFKSSPFFDTPIIDAHTYLELAQNVLHGFWLQDEAFWQPPLYPYFLALVLWLTGPDPFRVHLVHFLLGAINCSLLYFLGRRLFSRPLALAGAIIAAAYGPFLFFEGDYLPVPLLIGCNLALLLLLLHLPEHPSRFGFGAAGFLFGLSALTRPDILLFLPVALLWLNHRLRTSLPLQSRISRLALLVALGLLTISPATLHNAVTSREFILISSNGGINFYIGNHRNSETSLRLRPYAWDNFVVQPILAGAARPGERSEWFYRQALADIKQNPLAWLLRLGIKTGRFFRGHEFLRNQDPYLGREYSSLLGVLLWERRLAFPYGIIGPLGLLGLLLLACERRPDRLLLVFYTGAQVAAVALFMVVARYRLPTVPVLILTGAWVPVWLAQTWRRKKKAACLAVGLAGFGLIFASNRDGNEGPEMEKAEQRLWLGYAAKTHGRLVEAERIFSLLTEESPSFIPARLELAAVWAELGKLKAAQAELTQVLELDAADPGMNSVNAHLLWAKLALAQADPESALSHYRAALRIFPASGEAMIGLTGLLLAAGRSAEAEAVIQQYLNYYPRHPWPFLALASIRGSQNRAPEAISLYQRAAELNHLDLDTRILLARYHLARGERAAARRWLRQVLQRDPQNLPARQLWAQAAD